MRRAILAIPMLLAMTGCAEVWYVAYWARPGSSEADFARDQYDCDQSAFARFPPVTLGKPGYFSTQQSFCSPTPAGSNCVLINPGYLPQARPANDQNELPREQAFHTCMMAYGWRPTNQPGEGFALTPPGIAHPSNASIRAARAWCENHLKRNGAGGAVAGDALDQCIVTRASRSG
jgi:hypothetical protein